MVRQAHHERCNFCLGTYQYDEGGFEVRPYVLMSKRL